MTGNPVFRFQFIHATEGTFEITEPIGWMETKLVLERDSQFHSLIERFEGAFSFYGSNGQVNGGIDIIKYIENIYGVDADLTIDIDVSFNDGESFEDIFTGLYDFSENEENNLRQIRSAIIRNDFWTKFINRQDTPVNIQSPTGLDGSPVDVIDPISMILTGQIIPKTTTYTGAIEAGDLAPPEFAMPSGTYIDASGAQESFETYTQANIDLDQDEIDDSLDTVIDFITPPTDISPQIELPSEGGLMTVSYQGASVAVRLDSSLFMDSVEPDPSSIDNFFLLAQVFVQKNSETPIMLCSSGDSETGPPNPFISGVSVPFIRGFNFNLPPGNTQFQTVPSDTVRIYIKWSFFININVGADTGVVKYGNRTLTLTLYNPVVIFQIQSTFANSPAECFFVHDVMRSVIDRITDQNNSFESDYIGNQLTSPSYDEVGCGSQYVATRGLQIRKYLLSDKPFAISFKDTWSGLNPIFNYGLGYKSSAGKEIIEIDRCENFYDPAISVYFDYVQDIVRRYDNDFLFKKVDIGYQKWQSENLSGIDDPQTKHSYGTRFKKVGKPISIMSDWIAASLAIETTRRTTQKKSQDYKFDDETFIIAVSDLETTPAQVRPETNEHYTFITGLSNPETRYNSRITPTRNLIRWLKYLNGGLQSYVGSVYKFLSGEGNYDMDSDLENGDCDDFSEGVSEKQDIIVTSEFIHLPDLFEITMPMYWDEYKAIRNSPKKCIGISQSGSDHVAFCIKILEYDICKSRVRIEAWPKTPFEITQTDFMPTPLSCAAANPEECGSDSRETEGDEFRITEDGQCREIE